MESPKKVLIVEDEKNIVDILRFNLQRAGYATEEAYDGEDGLAKARSGKPDLILLDVMLPKRNGFDVCRALRAEGDNVPVLILTAREEEADKVLGLEIGADDYITKPFSMEELVLRIEAILRRVRGKKSKESSVYHIGRFVFDTQKQLLTIGDKQTKLTTKENELLALLCSHANEILQRDFALKTIWIDDNYFNARSMDVYITKLRKHLKDDDQIEIINIHGKGYKLITPEEA